MAKGKRTTLDWQAICLYAADEVRKYDTGVTLRQLFYRLVSAQIIPNTISAYARLSRTTAQARRDGWFPDLIDNTRGIQVPASWDTPEIAMQALIEQFRLDRTEGQEFTVYVAVEKNALRTQLEHWFGERGIPVLAMGGYPSQTFVQDIMDDIDRRDRPAILLYGGDFDATGVDILRDFEKRTQGYWHDVQRIALNQDQIKTYNLPPLPGKNWDPRAKSFEEKYGELVQVELDALPPNVLKQIYEDAVGQYWDPAIFDEVVSDEDRMRGRLVHPDDVERLLQALASSHHSLRHASRLRAKPSKTRKIEFTTTSLDAKRLVAEHGEAFDVLV